MVDSGVLKPMKRRSAVNYSIQQIQKLLTTGNIKPGDKLPSETELCKMLEVSRGSIRSAMKVFEALGVIDIRAGDGTYVCTSLSSRSFNPLLFPLYAIQPDFRDILVFRKKIEIDIMELIISDSILSERIIPILENSVNDLRYLQSIGASIEEFSNNEKAFHNTLAKGCGNVVFETVYSFIYEFFQNYIEKAHSSQYFGAIALSSHIQITEAIKLKSISKAKDSIDESMSAWEKLL